MVIVWVEVENKTIHRCEVAESAPFTKHSITARRRDSVVHRLLLLSSAIRRFDLALPKLLAHNAGMTIKLVVAIVHGMGDQTGSSPSR